MILGLLLVFLIIVPSLCWSAGMPPPVGGHPVFISSNPCFSIFAICVPVLFSSILHAEHSDGDVYRMGIDCAELICANVNPKTTIVMASPNIFVTAFILLNTYNSWAGLYFSSCLCAYVIYPLCIESEYVRFSVVEYLRCWGLCSFSFY